MAFNIHDKLPQSQIDDNKKLLKLSTNNTKDEINKLKKALSKR